MRTFLLIAYENMQLKLFSPNLASIIASSNKLHHSFRFTVIIESYFTPISVRVLKSLRYRNAEKPTNSD